MNDMMIRGIEIETIPAGEAIAVKANERMNHYIGCTLKELREAKGITQDQIAQLAGITPTAYRNLESGRSSLGDAKYNTVRRLADVLGTDVYNVVNK